MDDNDRIEDFTVIKSTMKTVIMMEILFFKNRESAFEKINTLSDEVD